MEVDNDSKNLEVYGSTTKMNQIITLANSESFRSKVKIAGKTPAGGNTKNVKLIVPLKYLSNLWRTLEMPFINCQGSLLITSY